MRRGGRHGHCWKKHGPRSPRCWAGVMTSFSPAAPAKRSRSSRPAHASPGVRLARPSMPSFPMRWGQMQRSSRCIPDGLIDEQALDAILAEGPALVAIQQVNNETGILQPLDRIAPKIREAGSLLLADCAQSAGKYPLPDADFIALSAHKLGGTARRRRPAGQGSWNAGACWRSGKGLSARNPGCAQRTGLRRRACCEAL